MKKIYFLLLSCFLAFNAIGQISKDMTLLAHWDADTFPYVYAGQYSDIWGITACGGTEIAVLGSTPYIHFFDITDVGNLKELAHFAGGGVSLWREFKSYKGRVYAVADQGNEGLIIFDVSNAPTITKTNQTTQFTARTHMPFIDEKNGRLYLAGSSSQSGGLIVLDLTKDPDNPTLLASVPLPGGYVHDLYVDNNIAYCSQGNNGLWVYDMNDPTNPILLGNMTSYPESGYNHSTWMTKDKKYLIQCDETHNTSVKTVDIQDLTDIKVVDLFKSALLAPAFTNSIPHNPYVRGNYSIISYYHDGVQVYDVSNPLAVTNKAWYDTEPNNTNYDGYAGMWGVYPFFESDKIVCSDLLNGMFIVKLNNIDLDSIHAANVPIAKLNYTGDVKICAGDSLLLTVPQGAQFYNWYKDGKMINSDKPILYVKTPGTYKAVIWNHACVEESQTLNLSLSDIKDPVITNSPPAGICPGDTLKLCTDGQAPVYEWQKDGQIQSSSSACQDVVSGGVYKVIAIDGTCKRGAPGVKIVDYTLPDNKITPDAATICLGDSVQIYASTAASSWQWFLNGNPISNATNASLNVTEAGNYSVHLTNDHCSANSNVSNIVVSSGPSSIFSFDGTVLTADQAESYQWFLNGVAIPGATSMSYTPTKSGTYSLQTTDIFGCVGTSVNISIVVSATHSVGNPVFKIYPNPVTDQLYFEYANYSDLTDWSIINPAGMVLKSGKFIDQQLSGVIATDDLAKGAYILNCTGKSTSLKLKFVRK